MNFRSHKMWGTDGRQLASQGLCSMELVNGYLVTAVTLKANDIALY
jgi:hypothetical protein